MSHHLLGKKISTVAQDNKDASILPVAFELGASVAPFECLSCPGI